jgi:hypothetical protein
MKNTQATRPATGFVSHAKRNEKPKTKAFVDPFLLDEDFDKIVDDARDECAAFMSDLRASGFFARSF